MDDVAVLPTRHRLTVDDYRRMADAGMVGRLAEALFIACAGQAIVWPQNPIRIDRWSEPQPDLALLRRRPDFYATGERPGPADVLLLIEVADSSLAFDRRGKLPLYARAGIAEFWIVDLKRRVLEVHRSPTGDGYADTSTHQPGDQVALALIPEIVVKLEIAFG
jgi:Uma2 family endonuclease